MCKFGWWVCVHFLLHSHTHRKLEKNITSQIRQNILCPSKKLKSKNKDKKIKPVYCKVMYLLLFNLVWQELRNVTNQEKKKQICFIILFSTSLACLVVSVLMLCILHLHFYSKQLTLHIRFITLSVYHLSLYQFILDQSSTAACAGVKLKQFIRSVTRVNVMYTFLEFLEAQYL